MSRKALLLTCSLLIAVGTFVSAASVHIRQSDGTWIEIQAAEHDDTIGFSVSADETDAGRALLVINKPAWMILEDETPPRVVSYSVAGTTAEPTGADAAIAIERLGTAAEERRMTFELSDDANPIDVNAARLRVEGRPDVHPEIIGDDRDARTATLSVDLNEFGPGAWEATLEVADLSPMKNTLRIPLEFSIAGAQIAGNQQTVTLSGGGAGFTVRGSKRETVTVDAAGVSAFLTLQPDGEKHLYVREFKRVEHLGGDGGWNLVHAEVALEDIDGEAVTDEQVGASVALRFAVHEAIPAIVVTTTATNLGATRSMYAFWGWLPGDGYVSSDGDAHEWTMSYEDAQSDGWLLLPSKNDGASGVGWISAGDFGESRFGTMLLYTDPRKPIVDQGESVVMSFALMPATEIDEVAEVAAELVDEGALELELP
ncbi:MAG: hypothetical protein R6V07_09510 [Armatimonadota bacterium]